MVEGFHDYLGLEVLLAHVLKVERSRLIIDSELGVTDSQIIEYSDLVRRFSQGEPVAYLVGHKEFYGLDFEVNENVLIPRPETELLVDNVIDYCSKRSSLSACKILDVGTGCGCIAISLAKRIPEAEVWAGDISHKALEVAERNAIKNEVGGKVNFVQSDLLENIYSEFDVIVANLPYIGEMKNRYISAETDKYEPHIALFGGDDGLDIYRNLFSQLVTRSWKPDLLIGEFGFAQCDDMRDVLNNYFKGHEWEINKDYANIERVFIIRFNK